MSELPKTTKDDHSTQSELTTLRQWSEQAREAMELMLNQADANADFCRTYTPQSRESARTLLAAHPAQGMEGRG